LPLFYFILKVRALKARKSFNSIINNKEKKFIWIMKGRGCRKSRLREHVGQAILPIPIDIEYIATI
jgi:hypothetical protein